LVVATDTEPDGFGEMFAGGKSGPEQVQAMVHRVLAELDDKGDYVPGVAAGLPSVARGTWTILPDGSSETIWHLRPNARWHDGTPVSVDDVVFTWHVALTPDVPYKSRSPSPLIENIQPVDEHTFVIHWKTVFVGAGRLAERELFLLPRHLLEPSFMNDRAAFIASPFWSSDFIGTGPYRIVDWVPGSHAQLEAFDGFFGGQSKIKAITFKYIPDITTAQATIRAGAVDVWLGSSLGIENAQNLKTEWEAGGGGRIIAYPRLIFEIRFRPGDPLVSDVRARKALYHAIDRDSIVRDMYFGLVQPAHSYIPPGSSDFPIIDAKVVKYPFDPPRTQALLGEIGWHKGTDGSLRNDRGETLTLPFSTTVGNREREQLQSVLANMWQATGIQTPFDNVPLTVSQDASYQFSTIDLSGVSADFEANIPRIDGRNLRSPQNPRGANVWGFSNNEVDRLIDQWSKTLDRPQQVDIEAQVIQRISDELPILPINYRLEAIAVATGISGVPVRTERSGATNTWNVETWTRS
jgi:peptide/nickel transport system substrate-binding protein